MTDSAEFKINYDGEALVSHSMDVKDLAPALLAFGQLFDEANSVLNQNKASVRLQVKAKTPGSFEIFFQLWQSYGSQITGFLTGDNVTSALNLIQIIAVGYAAGKYGKTSLFWLVRKLQGKKPEKITDLKNGFIQLDYGKENIVIPVELLRLYQDVLVRKATQEILEPLKKEGIDKFEIKNEKDEIIETITKNDVSYYALPQLEDEIILQTERKSAYSIISLAFKEDNKWRLYDGNSTISVTISDSDFLDKVDRNLISFSKGDILICDVKTTQYRTDTGLKTEYEVLKVKEHKKGARQLLLFDTSEK